MFVRKELKQAAKEILSKKYLNIFLTTLFVIIVGGGFLQLRENIDYETFETVGATISLFGVFNWSINIFDPDSMRIIQIFGVFTLIWGLFINIPLQYGLIKYYLNAYKGNEKFNQLFTGYKDGFGRVVMTFVLQNVYIFLWALLFFIPGVIAAYRYRFVPYILVEYPELSPNEVIKKSKEMTKGIKFDIFVLDLSFILWHMLSLFTLGISELFVVPYISLTDTKLYLFVKEKLYGNSESEDEIEVIDEEGYLI